MVKKANKSGEYRSFTVEGSSIGYEEGKFISKTPGGAAKKVARKLHRLIEDDRAFARYKNDKDVQFILRETTQGSAHKTLAYQAHKKKLAEPVVRKFPNGTEYTITHEYKALALKEHEVHPSLKSKL